MARSSEEELVVFRGKRDAESDDAGDILRPDPPEGFPYGYITADGVHVVEGYFRPDPSDDEAETEQDSGSPEPGA